MLATAPARAAGSIDSGEYTVHYSAVNSMQIAAGVARKNDIERNGETAVIIVTVQKPAPDEPLRAVPADVSGNAHDLMGNKTTLQFDRIRSADSVYSLASVPIHNDQTLTFDLEVNAENGEAVIPLRFNQTFFIE